MNLQLQISVDTKVGTEVDWRSHPGRPPLVMEARVQELQQPEMTWIQWVTSTWVRMARDKGSHVHIHSQQLAGPPARTCSLRNRTGLSQTPGQPNRPRNEPIMLMHPRKDPSPRTTDQSATLKVHDSLDALAGPGASCLAAEVACC